MIWVLGVIGFVIGVAVGFVNDWWIFGCGVAGAIVGAGAGGLLSSRKPRTSQAAGQAPGPATASAAAPPASDDRTGADSLAGRVERLEWEVSTLKRELARLRGQPDVAAESNVAPVPRPLDTRPLAIPPVTAAATSAAPLPGHETALPAQLPTADSGSIVPASASTSAATDKPPVAKPVTAPAEPPKPPQPPQPPVPREPDFIERLFKAGRDWLVGGNTVVRVGMIVLFFGLAFLLKYAADNNMLPIEFRLAGVALAATALLVIGWRVGDRRGAYGLVLQGGGVGVLYLTVFAATKLYHLLPAGAAFPLMVAICALSAFLAVRQDARALAFMGSAGGFLAPILLASGGGSHVLLFSYYALLNAGIFAIAWFKAWRPLNLLGFVFTFSIGTAWGVTAYHPGLFASTEPFLILFFLMYVGIALLYAVHRELALKHYVDGTLVFGTPVVVMGLQAALLKDVEFGLAWSAVGFAAFYLVVAAWLMRRRDRLELLFEAMLALAVIFATLAIPLAFSGPTTSAAWAIEGAAIVWLGVRQRRLAPFCFGIAMQIAAAGAFVTGLAIDTPTHGLPVLNSAYIATLLIALGGLFTGWWLHGRAEARAWHDWMPQIGLAAAAWGLAWWIGGGVNEILAYMPQQAALGSYMRLTTEAFVLFAVLTAWLAHAACGRLKWPLAEWPALALAPVLSLLVFSVFSLNQAPFAAFGWGVWVVAVVGAYLLLWREQRTIGEKILAPLHTLMFWNGCVLLALEGYWRLSSYVPEGAWSWSAWAYGFGLLLLLVAGVGPRVRWPIARFAAAYQVWGAAPLAALLWVWSIASVTSDGNAAPLFWLPILNPLDVAQLLALMAVVVWLRRLAALGVRWHPRALDYAALATLFLWFNALLLRTLHHRFGAAYDVDAVFESFGYQQVFLVGWSAFAFAGLWLARRDSIVRLCAIASTPLVAVMWLWTFYANLTQDGGSWGRLPLLNPLDLVQVVIYGIAALWLVRVNRLGVPVRNYRLPLQIVVGATAFLWLNTMLLRTLHHWTGIPYEFDAMAQSTLVQASVSVFWTVCALATMIWATRSATRTLWFVGAGLLALTVVKLFLFDLSHVTGIARIVSFIGIGVMLLLIGYFSPLPPKRAVRAESGEIGEGRQ
ncbi:hypothetical protein BWP39_07780 [Paraburkholderia acidicola]|uniref:DUF2339 domain-containing protein n=1 Tax=Paraburkholderia acidicola TaxID=1912599 RepID=A0A2A4F1W9_9BURK|nr:DUF2339 domain-containing protein [Paraburkholderia acidicola]PCE26682.1 hypothetical protein BWP39_07780 [Paraburkholderia acidicola]